VTQSKAALTRVAGQMLAIAVEAINTLGLEVPVSVLAAAVETSNAAQAAGATVQEIRQAGGLTT